MFETIFEKIFEEQESVGLVMANLSMAEIQWLCPELYVNPSTITHIQLTDLLNYPECNVSRLPVLEFYEEEYLPMHIRIMMTVIFMTLSIIGVIGNLLVITVVFKVPGMITPTNCYLVSLAASDCLFFLATAPTEISYLHVASSDYIFGYFGCKVFTYVPYLAINTSSMSITAFTIERFIGICYPLKARYICTVKRAKVILLFIWAFGILYNSPWLYLATLKNDETGLSCGFKLERDNWTYKVMFFGDFATFYIIPMFLYITIYGKIIWTLSRGGINEHSSLKTTTSDQMKLDPKLSQPNHTVPQEFFVNGGRKNSTKSKVQVIKMLAVVVLVFAICWLPYRAMVLYNSFADGGSKWDPEWYILLSKTMIFFNCAINPILYNVMSHRFRNAFKKFLKKTPSKLSYNTKCSIPPTILKEFKDYRNGHAPTNSVTHVLIMPDEESTPR
uniref:Thyrotropin-releasing hormone receptor n=1 Tax=Acrobeloides nanus TaxID=290746 RepID=A0A914CJV3_9BILA